MLLTTIYSLVQIFVSYNVAINNSNFIEGTCVICWTFYKQHKWMYIVMVTRTNITNINSQPYHLGSLTSRGVLNPKPTLRV